MNGGAELYLEYGFSMLSVMEIDLSGGKYKTEIYKMNGQEEAFGIFSVSKYRCMDMPDLSKFTCRTRYQFQICKGPYYINIINGTGNSSDSIASITIGKIITDKIMDKEIEFSGFLPGVSAEKLQSGCFLAKGRLGIVNGSPDLEDFFQEISDYAALIVDQDGKTIISVRFENKESYSKFIKLHNWESNNESTDGSVRKIADSHLLVEMTN